MCEPLDSDIHVHVHVIVTRRSNELKHFCTINFDVGLHMYVSVHVHVDVPKARFTI